MALPPRYGGLGIPNMMEIADKEYEYSLRATEMLSKAIVEQKDSYSEDKDKLHEVKMSITQDRIKSHEEKKNQLLEELS